MILYYTILALPTPVSPFLSFFFFNAPATTEIYTLSLHDALPICSVTLQTSTCAGRRQGGTECSRTRMSCSSSSRTRRSEEHTSELQSRRDLVCRLLLEKKKKKR